MNYCIYNKEYDQFLKLTYSYNELGAGTCQTKWIDKFVYALASSENNFVPRIETVWPEDTEHRWGNYFLFVYNHVELMNGSKNGMEDVNLITITDSVPDFKSNYFLLLYNQKELTNNSRNGMKDIKLITIIDGIPDFEKECAF